MMHLLHLLTCCTRVLCHPEPWCNPYCSAWCMLRGVHARRRLLSQNTQTRATYGRSVEPKFGVAFKQDLDLTTVGYVKSERGTLKICGFLSWARGALYAFLHWVLLLGPLEEQGPISTDTKHPTFSFDFVADPKFSQHAYEAVPWSPFTSLNPMTTNLLKQQQHQCEWGPDPRWYLVSRGEGVLLRPTPRGGAVFCGAGGLSCLV